MQDEEQTEGTSRHETGMATRNVEEASSTCKEEFAKPSQSETCMVEEQAPPA